MPAIYKHKQTATLIRITTLSAAVIVVLIVLATGDPMPLLLVGAALAIVAVLFGSLTVTIDTAAVSWHFGPGFWKKRLALSEIASVEAVKNPWWYGWGIHLTPRGWLYNVSGSEAVEIRLTSGKTLRIGTDEPGKLVQALRAAVGR